METYPVVLTIAGSDSGGGAGIQADLKTMSALGAFGTSAITAVTVQNTLGVKAIHSMPLDILKAQIDAVMTDFTVRAVKIGMVDNLDVVSVIVNAIREYKPPYVIVDPVMVATSGDILIHDNAIGKMKKDLFPLTDIITPNISEASILLGNVINNVAEMQSAAEMLCLSFGCKSALLKGGHLEAVDMTDVLWIADEEKAYTFSSKHILTKNLHGTGCSLSSAIATFLAFGEPITQAVQHAKEYVSSAIEAGKNVIVGQGNGPINHFFDPKKLKKININS
ncbi:MAG: bifunctional hydroxymethylpyrimidine kinase/phosphomethylpyrimidine kinase [Bacteroidales bacterium]|jgi:hydroxymethylpyrimidine/phosphomethylpyrimidine kinase|nr:bifunctional hydroxymethylpyrimidine kinase/phosphomethylpyrimidine kinase [Bacteroidales bacterium]